VGETNITIIVDFDMTVAEFDELNQIRIKKGIGWPDVLRLIKKEVKA